MTLANTTRENLARAAVEGLLGLVGACMAGMRARGVRIDGVTLVGGAARSEAVRTIAPTVWACRSSCPSRAMTWPTVRRGRPRGRSRAPRSLLTGPFERCLCTKANTHHRCRAALTNSCSSCTGLRQAPVSLRSANRFAAGEVAEAAGVNRRTLRYYERRGLLPPGPSPGGHRLYDDQAVTTLRVIKAAQRLGFTLEEVADLIEAGRPHGRDAGLQVAHADKLAEVEDGSRTWSSSGRTCAPRWTPDATTCTSAPTATAARSRSCPSPRCRWAADERALGSRRS